MGASTDGLLRLFQAWNEHGIEAWLGRVTEDVEWVTLSHEPDAGTYRGREGLDRLFRLWLDQFPDLKVSHGEILESGDVAITAVQVTGSGAASGVPVSGGSVIASRWRDGLLQSIHEYRSVAQAIEAEAPELAGSTSA